MTPEVFLQAVPRTRWSSMKDMSYQQRAVYVMQSFLQDFYLLGAVRLCRQRPMGMESSHAKDVAPVRPVDGNTWCLELWHGPTCAFKDMALQMLPHLLTASLTEEPAEEKTVCILVATSGDTGKAALEGFRDVDTHPHPGVLS